MPNKLRVGIAGLGRMGKRHATNFHTLTPRATVAAVSSPEAKERQWAAESLDGVNVYDDFHSMLNDAKLDAVVIASVTAVHGEQALAALRKGLHVLCEKPLSIDLKFAESIASEYRQSLKTHPRQKVMCGFSRRFDASYREAFARVHSNEYGSPVVFRSQTADMLDTTGFFVDYAKTSGGIFVDCSIHDIDLMLWCLGEDSKIKSLQAVGVAAVHTELATSKDCDNAIATIEFHGGKIATLYCSRMMAAGQEDTTEVICPKGSLRVNMLGAKNKVEIHDAFGARRELPKHYYERFQEAFVTEANEFTACCLDNLDLPISLDSSVRAVAIGYALQDSLVTGEKIYLDKVEARL